LYQPLFAFALKLTRDQNDAKDLVQETTVRAIQYRNKYRTDTNFKGWITTIMYNQFLTNKNRKARRNRVEAPMDDFLFALENKTVEGRAEENMFIKEVMEMLSELSNTCRIPFLMYYQGYPYREIAEKLGIPLGTVKSRISFARTNLRKRMLEQGYSRY
jgi:RNA polymerase sigma-70 factor (ECF subfamily)